MKPEPASFPDEEKEKPTMRAIYVWLDRKANPMPVCELDWRPWIKSAKKMVLV